MTFMLKATGNIDTYGELTEPRPDFAETFSAGTVAERVETDSWNRAARHEHTVLAEMRDRLGEDYGEGPGREWFWRDAEDRQFARERDYVLGRVAALRRDAPVGIYNDLPATPEDFEAAVLARRATELDDAEALIDAGSPTAAFLGRMWGAATDQSTVATLPFGVAGSGVRLSTVIATEAALNMGAEALTLPRQREVAEDLDRPAPNAALQIAGAGLLGGALGGVVGGAQRALDYRAARRAAETAQQVPGASALEHERRIEEARARAEGAPLAFPARREGAPDAPGTLGELVGGPRIPEPIRNGIFAGESGGDYDALFGFSNRPGGRYENVRLTEMTVDQAIEFSNPRGDYGQWVRGQVGRVATPMGAYQVVGTTLRAAKRALGLDGSEVMTRELQDRIGYWIWRTQGTGAWEGYRGPQSRAPVPDAEAGPAAFSPYTSRGYTGTGQVAVGDDLRIDVAYEVVDLARLRQATGELQPRDRGRVASDAWVADTAARLDPALLMPAPTADRGAPLVGPDDVIESGNGRVRALARAYDMVPDRADAYRRQIEAAGFEIPEGVAQPVLIARRRTELDDAGRRRLVVAGQDSGVARMTATERAQVGTRALTADLMALYRPGAALTSAKNRDFARAFASAFPRSERNAFVAEDGSLSIDGVRQVQDSLFARAWPAPDMIARAVEAPAGELRSLMQALADAAPSFARLRAAIDAGLVEPEMDISAHVLEAVRLIVAAREAAAQGGAVADIVDELLAQTDLFGGAVTPLAGALVRKFLPGGRQMPAARIAAFLDRYADEAMKAGRVGDALDPPGPLDVLKRMDPESFGELDEIGLPPVPEPAPQDLPAPEPEAMRPGDFADGAMSPEAQAADATAEAALRAAMEAAGEAPAPSPARGAATAADGDMPLLDALAELNRLGVDPDEELPGGVTPRGLMDELEADEVLDTVIDLCAARGAG